MFADAIIAVWRLAGLMAWPFLLLHPRARRHMIGMPIPTPGRTWLHGASLGEHRVVASLHGKLGPTWITHSSWRAPMVGTFPAPLDLPFVIGPWLDRARPGRIILIEGELWPGWIAAARARGIPVSVLSARHGPGWHRWQRFPSLFQALFSELQFLDAGEFGDLKALAPAPASAFELPSNTIIGASTRAGDECALVSAWEQLPKPRPLLVLAPRHLSRVPDALAAAAGHEAGLRSQLDGVLPEVLILDTLGELAGLLIQAQTVFIGGTFDPAIGGHSPLEAAAGGAHLLAGPHRAGHRPSWAVLHFIGVGAPEELGESLAVLQRSARPGPQHPVVDLHGMLSRLPDPIWQPERAHRPLLWGLTPLWWALSRIFRGVRRSHPLPRPTVVVGGLVAGGAGRTPVAAWLAAHLPDSVVLSAGYRREGVGCDVRTGAGAATLGDELEMLRRRGHPVISAPRRLQGIEEAPIGSTVIVDGGLSDPRLKRAFRLAVIDAQRPRAGGPIPVGGQRLPWSELTAADAIWITHWTSDAELPVLPSSVPVVRSHLAPSEWIHRGQSWPLSARDGDVDVAVGIAAPERFLCTLIDLGMRIQSLQTVRDHGQFGSLVPGTVLTEKDAARLPVDADVWALKMSMVAEGTDALLEAIASHHG